MWELADPAPHPGLCLCPGQPATLPAGLRKRVPQAGDADLGGKEMQRQPMRGECSSGPEQRETPTRWGDRSPRTNRRGHLDPLDTAHPEDSPSSSRNQRRVRLGVKGAAVCVFRFPAKATQAPGGGADQPRRGRAGACLRSAGPQGC